MFQISPAIIMQSLRAEIHDKTLRCSNSKLLFPFNGIDHSFHFLFILLNDMEAINL